MGQVVATCADVLHQGKPQPVDAIPSNTVSQEAQVHSKRRSSKTEEKRSKSCKKKEEFLVFRKEEANETVDFIKSLKWSDLAKRASSECVTYSNNAEAVRNHRPSIRIRGSKDIAVRSKDIDKAKEKNMEESQDKKVTAKSALTEPHYDSNSPEGLRLELLRSEDLLCAMRKEALGLSKLQEQLETDVFQKDLQLQTLMDAARQPNSLALELDGVRDELQQKNEQISGLEQSAQSHEEMLHNVLAEARAKGDAVEGLICSLTRQVQLDAEARRKVNDLEAQNNGEDDALTMLKMEMEVQRAADAVFLLTRSINEKEEMLRMLEEMPKKSLICQSQDKQRSQTCQ